MPRAGGEGEGRATRCPGDGSRWRSHGGTVCADRTSVGGGRRGGGKSGAEGGSRAWATLGAPRRAAARMGLDFRTGWPRRLGRRPRGESGLSRGARRAVQELLQDAPPPTPGVLPCSSPPHPVLRGPRRARHRDEHSAESRVILPHPSHA